MVIRSDGRFFSAAIDIGLMGADLGHGTDGLFHGSNMRRGLRSSQASLDFGDGSGILQRALAPCHVVGPPCAIPVAGGTDCHGIGIPTLRHSGHVFSIFRLLENLRRPKSRTRDE
jgi:hypothetical protein